MDASKEELSGLSSRSDDLYYTPTLVSSPKKDPHKHILSSQLNNFDLLVRHQSGSQVSQSNPDLFTSKAQDPSEAYNIHHWAEEFKGESLGKGQFEFSLMSHTLGCDFFPRGSTQACIVFSCGCYLTESCCGGESCGTESQCRSVLVSFLRMMSLCDFVRAGFRWRAEPCGAGAQSEE